MARIGQGTLLQVSSDGVNYMTIAELAEIGEFGLGSADDVDVTTHDSVDGYREFIRGLLDAGEISFTAVWEGATSQQDVIDRLQLGPNADLDYLRIVLPDSLGQWEARGYFKEVTINPQLDNRIELSGTIKVSGKPTFTV